MLLTSLSMWLWDSRSTSYRYFHCKRDHCFHTLLLRNVCCCLLCNIDGSNILLYADCILQATIAQTRHGFCNMSLQRTEVHWKSLQYTSSPTDFKYGLFSKDHSNLGWQQTIAINSYSRSFFFPFLKEGEGEGE